MGIPKTIQIAYYPAMIAAPIDLSPLAEVGNLAITTFVSVATVAIPMIGWYCIQWLRAHAAQMKQQTANAAASQIDNVFTKGFAYAAQQGADPIAGAAEYARKQAPTLFKNLGFDPETPEGTAAVVRMATARLVPTPTPPAVVNVNVDPPVVVQPKPLTNQVNPP
jgi:hypothetical protein